MNDDKLPRHRYFVAYSFPMGTGNMQIGLCSKISSYDDVKVMTKWMRDNIPECKNGFSLVNFIYLNDTEEINDDKDFKIQSLEQEIARLKEENLKMRNCENCIHCDMETECELTAITCTNYNKWEIKK